MQTHHEKLYRFLDWSAAPAINRLSREGQHTHVTPRAMDVLVYLMNQGGRVVSKEELLQEVWDGQAVTDDALVVTIYELRKALDDRARNPTYLQTVVRRGYRFLPEVEIAPGPAPIADTKPREEPRPRAVPFVGWPRGRRLAAALALAAGAATTLGLLGSNASSISSSGTSTAASSPVVAADPGLEALLVRARLDLDRRTVKGLDDARANYQEAALRDPRDARGFAGLAQVAITRADLRLGDPYELYHQARSHAERALEIDAELAAAHLALGTTALLLDWHSAEAAESLEKALALEPTDPDIHQVYAWLLSARGDGPAAETAARRAASLDPGSATRRADLAFVLIASRRHAAAQREAEAALALEPAHLSAWTALIRSHIARADLDAATDAVLACLASKGVPAERLEQWRQLAARDGYWSLTDRLLGNAESALVGRAGALAHLGQVEPALALLERALDRRDWEMLWLERLPELEILHADPRFQALVELKNSRFRRA